MKMNGKNGSDRAAWVPDGSFSIKSPEERRRWLNEQGQLMEVRKNLAALVEPGDIVMSDNVRSEVVRTDIDTGRIFIQRNNKRTPVACAPEALSKLIDGNWIDLVDLLPQSGVKLGAPPEPSEEEKGGRRGPKPKPPKLSLQQLSVGMIVLNDAARDLEIEGINKKTGMLTVRPTDPDMIPLGLGTGGKLMYRKEPVKPFEIHFHLVSLKPKGISLSEARAMDPLSSRQRLQMELDAQRSQNY